MNNRIIFSDNGVLDDWSTTLKVYTGSGKAFSYTLSQDYIYIGQRSPFNHIYIKMEKKNLTREEIKKIKSQKEKSLRYDNIIEKWE